MKYLDFYAKRIKDLPTPNSKGEVDIPCLFHKDSSPSLSINVETGKWKCHVPHCPGHRGGSYKTFEKMLTGQVVGVSPVAPDIDEATVTGYHAVLLQSQVMLERLTKSRGLSLDTIKHFELGFDTDRVLIPIRDKDGKLVNIRKYKPGAVRDKMVNYAQGYGHARLFPVENLDCDLVVLCEGEMDAMVAHQYGFPAITTTGGASTWSDDFSKELAGKEVVICYDADPAGKNGARAVAMKLLPHAKSVRVLTLPLPGTKEQKDITNYFVDLCHGAAEFQSLIDAAEVVQVTVLQPTGPGEQVVPIHLSEIGLDKYVGKRVQSTVLVAGKDLAPFQVPYHIAYSCEMGEKVCDRCGICRAGGQLEVKLPEWDRNLIKMANVEDVAVTRAIADLAKVPGLCRKFTYEIKEHGNIEGVKVIPEIDFSSERSEYVIRNLYYLGHGLEANHTYQIKAVVMPDPKNQYATAIIYDATPSQDNIEKFELNAATGELIKQFEPLASESVVEKFDAIHADLEANVTKIYQRRDLMTLFDLVSHSVLQFYFQGDLVRKGWVEALVIGDTRCGKSESVTKLIQHYRCGELVTGENASFAGLVGGMQQFGKNLWSITWGKFPLNDRRMLVIDELSGLPREAISQMSGIRSSGVAEIIKIQTERTMARVRSLWMSNPRGRRAVREFNSGIEAIQDLIGNPEDIARFDVAITVATGEVSLDVIHRRPIVSHRFTSEASNRLVYWAWSRRPDQVQWAPGAEDACVKHAGDLARRYVPPLVEGAEQRIKLARLAVAAAARVHSATPDGESILVKPSHVEFVAKFIDRVYSKPSMSFDAYSRAKILDSSIDRAQDVQERLDQLPSEFVALILAAPSFTPGDLQEFAGIGREQATELMSFLVRHRCARRGKYGHYKLPAFIEFLRHWRRGAHHREPGEEG